MSPTQRSDHDDGTIDAEDTRQFGKSIDFGRAAGEYGRHRVGFPDRFFTTLAERRIVEAGQRILDLGTGTGTLARGFALSGAAVTALDPSDALMRQARKLDEEAGVSVRYTVGSAERLDFEEGRFDTVSAGQCWHWFERSAAAAECFRVLTPGGYLVIAHFDWIPIPGNVVAATEALIETYNPNWNMGGGAGLYPKWLTDMTIAGFGALETFSFDVSVPYSHVDWRGRIQASAGVKASLDRAQSTEFDDELGQMLQRSFPQDPLDVPHRCWAVIGRKPG